MPNDIGNLLIRVTSVGFDQVLQDLQNLESVMSRLGSNSALGKISQQLDQMNRYLKDMHGDLGELVLAQEKNNKTMGASQRQVQDTADRFAKFRKILSALTSVSAGFWAAIAVPRKFLNSMEQIAAFNLSLTNMAINANTSRASLVSLGTAVEGLGGSRQGLAGTMARLQANMQGLRMGRGGGAVMDVASLYGLDIRGSGPDGLATPTELLGNVAKLFERLGDSEQAKAQKLDIKSMLGLDDGTFKLLNKGADEYNKKLLRSQDLQKKLASATEASERISELKSQVDEQWDAAKLRMLEASKPAIMWLLETSEKIAKFVQDNPGKSAAIQYGAMGGMGLWLLRKLGGLFGKGKGANGTTGGITDIASGGGAASPGGAASAGGSILGVLGDVGNMVATGAASAVNSVENADIVKNLIHIAFAADAINTHLDVLDEIKKILNERLLKSLTTDETDETDYEELAKEEQSQIESLVDSIARGVTLANERAAFLVAFDSQEKKSTASTGVTIGTIQITVSSNSADAGEVAREVREELFRQINESIEDATNGVKLL